MGFFDKQAVHPWAGASADQPNFVPNPFDPFNLLPNVVRDAINPFAPSEAAEQAVKNAAAAWAELEPKMAADPKVAALLKPQHDAWVPFYANWQAGRKDVSAVNAAVDDVNVARRNAGNFDQSTDSHPVRGIDIEHGSRVLEAGTQAEDYCRAHPKDTICQATAPDGSWCQRLGLPATVCDKEGIRSWVFWAAGGTGAALLAGLGLVVWRLGPAVARAGVAVYAPEALPYLTPRVTPAPSSSPPVRVAVAVATPTAAVRECVADAQRRHRKTFQARAVPVTSPSGRSHQHRGIDHDPTRRGAHSP